MTPQIHQRLKAILVLLNQFRDDKIERLVAMQHYRMLAVFCMLDQIALGGQHQAHHGPMLGVIIHQQNGMAVFLIQ
jgi:hypothetical protein